MVTCQRCGSELVLLGCSRQYETCIEQSTCIYTMLKSNYNHLLIGHEEGFALCDCVIQRECDRVEGDCRACIFKDEICSVILVDAISDDETWICDVVEF